MADGERATFADQLRRYRTAAGLTQEELAERAGLTAKGIAALERGRRQHPYPHTIVALADALALTGTRREGFVEATQRPAATATAAPEPSPAPSPATGARPPIPTLQSRFIGREAERAALAALLAEGARLITLIGPGGVGKTRLALAVAADNAASFADGVAFAGLGNLADPALVSSNIAAGLGLREDGVRPAQALVGDYLAPRRLLLVIDNCEHLLAAVPDIAQLLAAAPQLAILATSRAPLRLRGEREWAVPPFALPDLSRLPTADDLAGNPAVELFVARGRDVAPAFGLTQANAAAVAAICRRLDGLPLAIELAAARIRLLNPTELLARLDRALPLLAGGARDLPERQRTMRDTIAWSYDLLSPEEQHLFRRLALFARGWDLAAAEAVGGGRCAAESRLPTDSPPTDTLDTLAALVEQSLVIADHLPDGTTRYRMLVGVREFAREQLERQGEADDAQLRHAEYFVALAERAAPELSGPDQVAWIARLEAEHDNVRMALPWTLAAGRLDLATRLGWALHIFWATRGHHREGLRWMEAALARGDLAPLEEARAYATAGLLVRMQGGFALAVERLQAALERFRALGDTPSVLVTLSRLGQAARFAGDYPLAIRAAEEGLALARAEDDRERIVWMLDILGILSLVEADFTRAIAIFAEALVRAQETGDVRYIAASYVHSGLAMAGLGRLAEADAHVRRALAMGLEVDVQRVITQALDAIACVASAQGAHDRAARLFAAAGAIREHQGLAQWSAHEHLLYDRYYEPARAALGPQPFAAAQAAGRALPFEQVIALALAND